MARKLRWTDVHDIAIELEERSSRHRQRQPALHRPASLGDGTARFRGRSRPFQREDPGGDSGRLDRRTRLAECPNSVENGLVQIDDREGVHEGQSDPVIAAAAVAGGGPRRVRHQRRAAGIVNSVVGAACGKRAGRYGKSGLRKPGQRQRPSYPVPSRARPGGSVSISDVALRGGGGGGGGGPGNGTMMGGLLGGRARRHDRRHRAADGWAAASSAPCWARWAARLPAPSSSQQYGCGGAASRSRSSRHRGHGGERDDGQQVDRVQSPGRDDVATSSWATGCQIVQNRQGVGAGLSRDNLRARPDTDRVRRLALGTDRPAVKKNGTWRCSASRLLGPPVCPAGISAWPLSGACDGSSGRGVSRASSTPRPPAAIAARPGAWSSIREVPVRGGNTGRQRRHPDRRRPGRGGRCGDRRAPPPTRWAARWWAACWAPWRGGIAGTAIDQNSTRRGIEVTVRRTTASRSPSPSATTATSRWATGWRSSTTATAWPRSSATPAAAATTTGARHPVPASSLRRAYAQVARAYIGRRHGPEFPRYRQGARRHPRGGRDVGRRRFVGHGGAPEGAGLRRRGRHPAALRPGRRRRQDRRLLRRPGHPGRPPGRRPARPSRTTCSTTKAAFAPRSWTRSPMPTRAARRRCPASPAIAR